MAYSNLPEVTRHDAPQAYTSTHDAPEVAPVGNHYYNKGSPEAVPQTFSPQIVKQDYPEAFHQQQHGATSPYSTSPGPQHSVLYYPPPSAPELGTDREFPAEKHEKGNVVIKRRTCIILAIVLAIVVVGAIVGGAVGGVMASRKNEAQSGGTGTGGDNNGGGNLGGGGNNGNGDSNGGGVSGGGGNNTIAPPKNPNAIVMEESGISAVSYTVDGTDYKMLFWQPQNSPGEIKYSAWDSKGRNWEVIDLKSRLKGSANIEATPGTAIATAVRPGDAQNGGGSFTLSVVYNGPSGSVHELTTTDVKGTSWEKITYTIKAGPRTQLAARWDVCPNSMCTDTLIVAYENVNKQIRLYYPHVVEINSQKHRDFAAGITTGSGIALTAFAFTNASNEAASMKVYHQATNLLSEATRKIDWTYQIYTPQILPKPISLDKPPLTYATSFEKPGMGLIYLAVVQRYPDNGRLTLTYWDDKQWIPTDPRSTRAVAGVSLDSGTSAVSLSMDMKVYVVPDNCESIQIFDIDKEDPGLWTHAGDVKLK